MHKSLCVAVMLLSVGVAERRLELVSVQKIWDEAPHNAFTDLIRFQDRWYCTFREADAHVGGNGRLRVVVSDDGNRWQSAAVIVEEGIDLRDPKLSVTPNGRLMIVAGGSVYEGRMLKGRQPRVAFSPDGRDWSPTRRILSEGDWLWRVAWHRGRAYGVSYRSDGGAWTGVLYASDDGLRYDPITQLQVPGVSEVTVRVLAAGEMLALARRESDDRSGWIGTSPAPYTQWRWRSANFRLGGPNFIEISGGDIIAASRHHTADGAKTALGRLGARGWEPTLTLPSGGDTSYPGLVWHESVLWLSYYSSHEGKSSIYLARVRLHD